MTVGIGETWPVEVTGMPTEARACTGSTIMMASLQTTCRSYVMMDLLMREVVEEEEKAVMM